MSICSQRPPLSHLHTIYSQMGKTGATKFIEDPYPFTKTPRLNGCRLARMASWTCFLSLARLQTHKLTQKTTYAGER